MNGRHTWRFFTALMLALGTLTGCRLDGDGPLLPAPKPLPPGFPEMPVPVDNQPTAARIALGKQLFYDPILSSDSTISCGSCHFQEKAFADYQQFSEGVQGRIGFRNAPALFNLAWHPYFFMDGGVPTLEQQVLAPIEAHVEMNSDMLSLLERLSNHDTYPDKFRVAYGRNPDPFSLTRAIAAFERTLISGTSRYDAFSNGTDPQALSAAEIRGMNLFFSDSLHCGTCHSGFDFTNYEFANVGLPVTTPDSGRMRVTLNEADRNKYKTPSLRNIALTAPYMHDGSIQTLDELVNVLASGGTGEASQSPLTLGFTISPSEKQDLIAFLNALTDEAFVSDPAFEK